MDISSAVKENLSKLGPDARVAVLPQGPLTIRISASRNDSVKWERDWIVRLSAKPRRRLLGSR
jgi:hypothetical protein